jgi:quinate dehydrogenase
MSLATDFGPEYTLPSPPELDGVTYLYGHPLRNSLCPLLHRTIYSCLNLNWAQIPLSTSPTSPSPSTSGPEQQTQLAYTLSPPIPTFLSLVRSSSKFRGSSVTMPHKVSILPHLDDLTDEARGVGACNTIFFQRQGEPSKSTNDHLLVGTNTDCIGIRESLLRHASPTNKSTSPSSPALIVGGGGTARAAIYALTRYLHYTTIYIINRDESEVLAMISEYETRSSSSPHPAKLHHIISPSEIPALQPPSVIVSGIPDYPPTTPSEVQAREVLDGFLAQPNPNPEEPRLLLEMCYHPNPWTSIAEAGSRSGWKVILGTEAMVWQGLEQARLWTGRDEITTDNELIERVKRVIAESLKERAEESKLT